jgi:hypothetical protein
VKRLPYDPVAKMFTTPSERTWLRLLTPDELEYMQEELLQYQRAGVDPSTGRLAGVTLAQSLNWYRDMKNW